MTSLGVPVRSMRAVECTKAQGLRREAAQKRGPSGASRLRGAAMWPGSEQLVEREEALEGS